MGIWLRVFDPKGYERPYQARDWREVEGQSKVDAVQPVRTHRTQTELQPKTVKRPPADTQARVKPPEPGDDTPDQEEEPDDHPPEPHKTTLKEAKPPIDLEKEVTDKGKFYGPAEITGIAADFMRVDYPTVNRSDQVGDAAEILKEKEFNHLLVMSERKTICGLLTETQIFRQLIDGKTSPKQLNEKKVSDVMITPVLCCVLETPLQSLIEVMLEEEVGFLPVIDSQDLLQGVVTREDVLRFVYKSPHFFKPRSES